MAVTIRAVLGTTHVAPAVLTATIRTIGLAVLPSDGFGLLRRRWRLLDWHDPVRIGGWRASQRLRDERANLLNRHPIGSGRVVFHSK